MKNQIEIRKLFNPTQPQVQLNENIFHREIPPDARLQPYIWCYWEIKSYQPLTEPFSCKIASDGCVDIFFDVNNSSQSYAMGFYDRYSTYVLGSSFHYAGIRFLPGMFSHLFNTKSSELSNTVEHLDSIHAKTSKFLIENIHPNDSIIEFKCAFDKYFLNNLQNIDKVLDTRFHEAILIIFKNTRSLNIENDIGKNIRISQRHLRRIFEFYIGDNIKSFARVVRFQSYLRAHFESQEILPDSLYYDFGYYDQGHFIKEFKKFSGDTPSKTLRNQNFINHFHSSDG
jgi:AraC-like DNA-binding protein